MNFLFQGRLAKKLSEPDSSTSFSGVKLCLSGNLLHASWHFQSSMLLIHRPTAVLPCMMSSSLVVALLGWLPSGSWQLPSWTSCCWKHGRAAWRQSRLQIEGAESGHPIEEIYINLYYLNLFDIPYSSIFQESFGSLHLKIEHRHDFEPIQFGHRSGLGGRIFTVHDGEPLGGHYDLGPAWFWPPHREVFQLADELKIPYFRQYEVSIWLNFWFLQNQQLTTPVQDGFAIYERGGKARASGTSCHEGRIPRLWSTAAALILVTLSVALSCRWGHGKAAISDPLRFSWLIFKFAQLALTRESTVLHDLVVCYTAKSMQKLQPFMRWITIDYSGMYV